MRISSVAFVASLFLILEVPPGRAQSTIVIQEKVAVSRVLAGHADIGIVKTPAEGITVELCGSGWHDVLASTTTDAKGYFLLDKPKTGNLFYLRLSAPGVNPYELRVRTKKSGRPELQIHLSNAT
jgi:hypothetical protein